MKRRAARTCVVRPEGYTNNTVEGRGIRPSRAETSCIVMPRQLEFPNFHLSDTRSNNIEHSPNSRSQFNDGCRSLGSILHCGASRQLAGPSFDVSQELPMVRLRRGCVWQKAGLVRSGIGRQRPGAACRTNADGSTLTTCRVLTACAALRKPCQRSSGCRDATRTEAHARTGGRRPLPRSPRWGETGLSGASFVPGCPEPLPPILPVPPSYSPADWAECRFGLRHNLQHGPRHGPIIPP